MPENTQTEAERQEFKEKYSKELSAGTYAKKQIYDLIVSFGSMAIGAVIGSRIGAKSNAFDSNHENTRATGILGKKVNLAGGGTGLIIGSIIGQLIQGYERWFKNESERLAVSEINEDIANMKIRDRTDEGLVRENDRLREMLEVEEQKTATLTEKLGGAAKDHLKKGKKSPLDHSEREALSEEAQR